jgi:hypothetical protein
MSSGCVRSEVPGAGVSHPLIHVAEGTPEVAFGDPAVVVAETTVVADGADVVDGAAVTVVAVVATAVVSSGGPAVVDVAPSLQAPATRTETKRNERNKRIEHLLEPRYHRATAASGRKAPCQPLTCRATAVTMPPNPTPRSDPTTASPG